MTPEKRETAIKWLQNEIRSLRLAPTINGCGPENWADLLEIMETCLEAVRGHGSEPIAMEQLRKMDGKPVWVDSVKQWGIVDMLDKVVALPGYGVIDLAAIGNKGAYAYSLPITDLLARAEAAEARVRELETSFRTEKCENGPECVGLGRVLSALAEAEDRAEKAERERDAAVSDLTFAVNQYRLFTTDIDLCGLCKFDLPPSGESGQTAECPGFYKDNCFEWRGQKEE